MRSEVGVGVRDSGRSCSRSGTEINNRNLKFLSASRPILAIEAIPGLEIEYSAERFRLALEQTIEPIICQSSDKNQDSAFGLSLH